MKVKIETITPELAKRILEKNYKKQRSVRKSHCTYLAKEMREGRWRVNGETIVFSEKGTLINGQHRINAVVQSGVACDFLVVRDIPEDYFNTMDKVAPRNGADALTIAGFKNSAYKAAAAQIFWRSTYNRKLPGHINRSDKPANSEILDLVKESNSALDMIHPTLKSLHKSCGLNVSVSGGAFLILSSISSIEEAKEFLIKMSNGDSKVLMMFRDRMVNNLISQSKLPNSSILALLIKTWNYYRTDNCPKKLYWGKDSTFPIPV